MPVVTDGNAASVMLKSVKYLLLVLCVCVCVACAVSIKMVLVVIALYSEVLLLAEIPVMAYL